MAIRSFLAFELPPEMGKIIAELSGILRRSSLNVRWVRASNVHLTVVFLGDLDEAATGPVQEAVGHVCADFAPFSVSLRGMGIFGGRRSPRVLWAGLDGEIDRMEGFRDRLHQALAPFGVGEEKRPFRPHLTLGRFRKGATRESALNHLLHGYQDLGSNRCMVHELVMFRSDLGPGGAVYHQLKRWPLTGNG